MVSCGSKISILFCIKYVPDIVLGILCIVYKILHMNFMHEFVTVVLKGISCLWHKLNDKSIRLKTRRPE